MAGRLKNNRGGCYITITALIILRLASFTRFSGGVKCVYFREHEAQVLCNIIKMLNKRRYSPPSSAAVIYLMLPNMVLQILYITAGGERFHSETTIVSDFQASVPMHGVHARSRFICRCWRPPKLALVTSVR